jgi:hypothetical protein
MTAVAVATLVMSWPVVAEEQVYKWTDEQGVIHFSNSSLPRQFAAGAEVRAQPPARGAGVARPNAANADVPLIVEDRKKFVRARLEGTRSTRDVMMLVDTGAQMSMIDEAVAEEVGAEFQEEAGIIGVTGIAPGWLGRIRSLQLGDKEVRDWTVMVSPMPGVQLLGMDVLERLRLHVGMDYLETR